MCVCVCVCVCVCARVYGTDSETHLISEDVMLQQQFDGHQLHQLVRFWCAVWKVRNVLVRGLRNVDDNDLVHHFISIVDDPWLIGHPETRSRAERRRSRVRPPQALPD